MRTTKTAMKRIPKKTLAVLLSFVLVVSFIPMWGGVTTSVSAADYGVSNPTTDSNGVTTWDCIYFGNYYQSSEETKEPIKWRVLSVDGDDAFLLADQNLDCQSYKKTYTSVTWESCTLRTWLNDTFYNTAFNAAEQAAIKTTTVVNEDNPYFGTSGGNDTQDKVYLLSIAEVSNASYGFNSKYNTNSKTRVSTNTAHVKAVSSSMYTAAAGSADGWWLRSPGDNSDLAATVDPNGYGCNGGTSVYGSDAVRPALHFHLSSSSWSKAGQVTSEGGSTTPPASATPSKVPSTPATDNGFACTPSLNIHVGDRESLQTSIYAGTKEEMASLCSNVTWTSSDITVATVKSAGFIQPTSATSYSGTEGSYSIWQALGLVSVTGKRNGFAVITGKLADGTTVSCKVAVARDSEAASSDSVGNGGSITIGEDKEGNADDGKSGVAQFFPANWSLKSTIYPVEISQKEDTENNDGSYTLKATIGIGKSDLLDKDAEWSKYKKACKAANESSSSYDTLDSYRELWGLKSSTVIHSSGWKGSKPSFSVMGYVEDKFDKYGNLISAEGRIAGDLDWSGDVSWQFATPIGPMYLKLGADGKASFDGKPFWDEKEKHMAMGDTKITITPSISLTGGYGIDKVASISATGKASIGIQAIPMSKGTFTAEASVNVYALFVINHTWTLAKFTKPWWDTTGGKKALKGLNTDNIDLDTNKLSFIDTSFADKNNWLGGKYQQGSKRRSFGLKKAFAAPDNKLTLKEGLLPSSLPMLASIGDKQVMVWQDYDGDRSVANSSSLSFSVYENGAWSAPKAVSDDGFGDACADMQVIDGKLYLTWQKHKVAISESEDAAGAIGRMGEKAEIYFAEFDSAADKFINITQVTDNTSCDMMPKFVKGSDKVQVAYVRNSKNSLLQSEGTNTIYVSAWNGKSFDAEQKLSESPGTVERYIAYAKDNKAKAMYISKSDEIMAVLNSDNEIVDGLNDLLQFAEDGTISAIDYTDGKIQFISNGLVYSYNLGTKEMVSYTAGDDAFDATAVYCTNGTKSGYVWSSYDDESDMGSIMASVATDKGYSKPVTLYEAKGEITRHIAPTLTKDGEWKIGLNQELTKDGTHTLSYLCKEETKKTSLISAYVNEEDVKDGMTGIDYIFKNQGDGPVSEITVRVTLEDGSVIEKKVQVNVNAGETVSGTVYMDLSKAVKGQDIKITVYATGEDAGAANQVADKIEQTDVSIVGTALEEDGKLIITAYATNKGKRDAKVKITLFKDAEMKEQLISGDDFDVSVGETIKNTYSSPISTVEYDENGTAYITLSVEVEGGDFNSSDNVTYLALYKGEKVYANTEGKNVPNSVVDDPAKPTESAKPTTKPTDSSDEDEDDYDYTSPSGNGDKDVSNSVVDDLAKPTESAKPTTKPTDTPDSSDEDDYDYTSPSGNGDKDKTKSPAKGKKLKDSKGTVYTVTKSGRKNGEVSYTSPKNKKITSVMLPATVKLKGITYKVTSIKTKAFYNCKKLKKTVIGKNIKTIGKQAFYGCTKLKSITIKTAKLTSKTVGSRAFAKINKKAVIKVPKKKLKAYRKILRKKGANGIKIR